MASATIAQMRAVEALARTGRFSRAAEDLGVSQPTVSVQVQALQDICKARIFIRDGHSIRLAPGADALIAKIRVALKCIDEVDRSIADTAELKAGELSVGFSAHRLIMPTLAAFVRQYPALRIQTRGGPSLELANAVFNGELDLAAVSQECTDSRFASTLLRRSRIAVYGAKGHPLLAKGSLTLGDLDGQPMVLWNSMSGTRVLLEDAVRKSGVRLKTVLEVATLDVAYATAAAGIGLAVSIEGEVAPDDHIDVVPIVDPELAIGHYLITLPDCREHAAISAFFALAARYGAMETGATPR